DKPITYDLNLNLNINLDSFNTNSNLLGSSSSNNMKNYMESFASKNSVDGYFGDFDTLNIPETTPYNMYGFEENSLKPNVGLPSGYAENGFDQYFDNTFGTDGSLSESDQLSITNIWNDHFANMNLPE